MLLRPGHSCRFIRRDQLHAGKVRCEATCITRQNGMARHGGVRANEEITEDVAFRALLAAIAQERFAGEKQGCAWYLDHVQAQVVYGPIQRFNG